MPTGAFHKLNIYEGKDASNYAMIMPVLGQCFLRPKDKFIQVIVPSGVF